MRFHFCLSQWQSFEAFEERNIQSCYECSGKSLIYDHKSELAQPFQRMKWSFFKNCGRDFKYIYIYIYIYTHTHTYIYTYIYIHTYICIYPPIKFLIMSQIYTSKTDKFKTCIQLHIFQYNSIQLHTIILFCILKFLKFYHLHKSELLWKSQSIINLENSL